MINPIAFAAAQDIYERYGPHFLRSQLFMDGEIQFTHNRIIKAIEASIEEASEALIASSDALNLAAKKQKVYQDHFVLQNRFSANLRVVRDKLRAQVKGHCETIHVLSDEVNRLNALVNELQENPKCLVVVEGGFALREAIERITQLEEEKERTAKQQTQTLELLTKTDERLTAINKSTHRLKREQLRATLVALKWHLEAVHWHTQYQNLVQTSTPTEEYNRLVDNTVSTEEYNRVSDERDTAINQREQLANELAELQRYTNELQGEHNALKAQYSQLWDDSNSIGLERADLHVSNERLKQQYTETRTKLDRILSQSTQMVETGELPDFLVEAILARYCSSYVRR